MAQSSYTHSEIDSHAHEKELEISSTFMDVFEYVTDVLKIYYSACAKPDKFEDFINSVPVTEENNLCSPWKTEQGQKSLILMVLTAYATAWDTVMASFDRKVPSAKTEKEAEKLRQEAVKDRQEVTDLYGKLLACFVQDSTLTYVVTKKKKSPKTAEEVCAAKLRNAIAHLEKSKLVQQESPWVMEFNTNWDEEIHSFKITPRNFCRFLSLFYNISRFGFLTREAITKMLKHIVLNDKSFPEKLQYLLGEE